MAFRNLGDTTVVIELSGTRNFHELNDSAAHIWNLCDGTHTSEEIALSLAQAFAVEPGEAMQDTQEFLAEMQKKNLVALR